MTATLTFDLPEEQEEFETAVNGQKYRSVLSELDNYLRGRLKYSDLTDEQYKIHEEIREKLWGELNNEHIPLH